MIEELETPEVVKVNTHSFLEKISIEFDQNQARCVLIKVNGYMEDDVFVKDQKSRNEIVVENIEIDLSLKMTEIIESITTAYKNNLIQAQLEAEQIMETKRIEKLAKIEKVDEVAVK